MTLREDIDRNIDDLLNTKFDLVKGRVVPRTEDLQLNSGARQLEAVYMYADMADSTGLAATQDRLRVAKVIRTYVSTASRIMLSHGADIKSFDGDRVMGVFHRGDSCNDAVSAALQLNFAVSQLLQPAYEKRWRGFKWTLKHGVGLDVGDTLIVRAGVRQHNDLVSIGRAPNIAAKLSELRGRPIHITASVHDRLVGKQRWADEPKRKSKWQKMSPQRYGNDSVDIYSTTWRRSL